MGMLFGRRTIASISTSVVFVCAAVFCLGSIGSSDALAQDAGSAGSSDGSLAATGMIMRDGDSNGTDDDDRDDGGIMTLALWDSAPGGGWLKFLDHSGSEMQHKEIAVAGQLSYTMPTLGDVGDVDHHAGQGLSGNADWKPIAWQSQWFDVGGQCQEGHTLSQCRITGHGGFAPPTIQGSRQMRRLRPGDTVNHPTASGSNPIWMIYHKSWVLYAGQLRYAANGGSGAMQSTSPDSSVDLNSETYFYNISATLAANGFTRPGYRFTGWKSRATGVVWQPGETVWVATGRHIASSDEWIYEAQWERLPQVTAMPSTGGWGFAATYAAGAGLGGVACGGMSSLIRRRGERRR